jgi:hypothetical protein
MCEPGHVRMYNEKGEIATGLLAHVANPWVCTLERVVG